MTAPTPAEYPAVVPGYEHGYGIEKPRPATSAPTPAEVHAEGLATHLAVNAEERGEGICRTCVLPIWFEVGQIDHREREGWSDRIKRGGDSVVCFKAIDYRHVPLTGREAAIYDLALSRSALDAIEEAGK